MEIIESIEFTIRVGYIESINKYLIPIGKGKVAMSPECKAFKMEVKNQLNKCGARINSDKKSWFKLSCSLVFKCSFGRRDSNNCIKILVDAICEYFGLNDNHLIYEEYRKMWKQPSNYEYIKCRLDIIKATENDFKL